MARISGLSSYSRLRLSELPDYIPFQVFLLDDSDVPVDPDVYIDFNLWTVNPAETIIDISHVYSSVFWQLDSQVGWYGISIAKTFFTSGRFHIIRCGCKVSGVEVRAIESFFIDIGDVPVVPSKDLIELMGSSSDDSIAYQSIGTNQRYPDVPDFQALSPKNKVFLFIRSKYPVGKALANPKVNLFGALKPSALISDNRVIEVPITPGTEVQRKIDVTDFMAGFPYAGVTVDNFSGLSADFYIALVNSD